MAVLEQCKGTIKDGLCNKCYARSASTGTQCTQVYEIYPPIEVKISPELERYLKQLDELKEYLIKINS
jgi:hypothetical protein